ncbi:MAG TPA: UDP-glucose/GDP-mannose dehydrogenase family protein [Edaphocola sp.]|nr:UDP-glucose/GDP-mannose dehydrogenase family protein [Edaphocola sp.]
MNVAVVGSGYVGLVTGACLSEVGSKVTCVDVDEVKVENLKKGVLPIYEPGLEEMVLRNMRENRLSFSTNLPASIQDVEVVFIAVGTPPSEDGSADLQYVLSVARAVGRSMERYVLVVTKSTVPVGTSGLVKEAIAEELAKRGKDISFDVASNPEFLKEGMAIQDFMRPDRIVAGVESQQAKELLENLYQPFVLNGHPLMFMEIPSAELTKYAANAMLATRISFMNDMANLCELVGADINEVRKGIAADPRIGNKFLYSGAGYGGSCFPKDVQALVNTGSQIGHPLRILESVESVNKDQKQVLFRKINRYFNNDLEGKIIALWGLAFKPNTDDMREAPSLVVIEKLIAAKATVRVFDPVAMPVSKKILGDKVIWCNDLYDAASGSDAIALVTEWNEFRLPDWKRLGGAVRHKALFDGRNIYNKSTLQKAGFSYFGIGQ